MGRGGPVVFWFRRDLRLGDNPALIAASRYSAGSPILPVFVVEDSIMRSCGPNRRRFLAGCLEELSRSLERRLVVLPGGAETALIRLIEETRARAVFATADYTPWGSRRDARVSALLRERGVPLFLVGSPYRCAPGALVTGKGRAHRRFAPFYRAWLEQPLESPLPVPDLRLAEMAPGVGPAEIASLDDARLPAWTAGLRPSLAAVSPAPGEMAAMSALRSFLEHKVERYAETRSFPGLDGTSRLSAYLRFGCVHPRTVLWEIRHRLEEPGPAEFARQLAWREFYASILHESPRLAWEAYDPRAGALAVDSGEAALERFRAWATGRTGYALVDAGMRQLALEGFMHNRARMVAASFLVKDLHLDWRWGARWFLWHLFDADLASNNSGWQWCAGLGVDAPSFARIFNPERQLSLVDPDGTYVRRYLGPEGEREPRIVDHGTERLEALRRWRRAREERRGEVS
jgi:deoxyribodipyrimidine photo-lyase